MLSYHSLNLHKNFRKMQLRSEKAASVHCLSGSCSLLDCSRSSLDVPFKSTNNSSCLLNMGSGHATKTHLICFLANWLCSKTVQVEFSTWTWGWTTTTTQAVEHFCSMLSLISGLWEERSIDMITVRHFQNQPCPSFKQLSHNFRVPPIWSAVTFTKFE